MAKLSSDQVAEAADLRETRGWSYKRIGLKLGVSPGAIHYQCLRQGAVSPRTRAIRRVGPQVIHAKDGRTQRRFTPDEDKRLLELEAEQMSICAIARTVGRPRTSVRIRLMTLALREEGYARG